jgi:hypothetical protein
MLKFKGIAFSLALLISCSSAYAQRFVGNFAGNIEIIAYFDLETNCYSLACKPASVIEAGIFDWRVKKVKKKKRRFRLINNYNQNRAKCQRKRRILTCSSTETDTSLTTRAYNMIIDLRTSEILVSYTNSLINTQGQIYRSASYAGVATRR